MMDKIKTWSWKQIALLMLGVLSLVIIGCEPLLYEVWPVMAPKETRKYLFEDPNATRAVVSMVKAEEMREDVMIKHRDYLIEMRRNIEDDEYAFQDAMLIDDRIEESRQWKEYLIGDKTNPLSVASLLAGTSLAGFIGYKVKRRGDSTPEEVNVRVATAVDEERKKNGIIGTTGSGGIKKKA